MLNKAIYILENKLRELKDHPYNNVGEYIESLEIAVAYLKQSRDYEKDLDSMYEEYLTKL